MKPKMVHKCVTFKFPIKLHFADIEKSSFGKFWVCNVREKYWLLFAFNLAMYSVSNIKKNAISLIVWNFHFMTLIALFKSSRTRNNFIKIQLKLSLFSLFQIRFRSPSIFCVFSLSVVLHFFINFQRTASTFSGWIWINTRKYSLFHCLYRDGEEEGKECRKLTLIMIWYALEQHQLFNSPYEW